MKQVFALTTLMLISGAAAAESNLTDAKTKDLAAVSAFIQQQQGGEQQVRMGAPADSDSATEASFSTETLKLTDLPASNPYAGLLNTPSRGSGEKTNEPSVPQSGAEH